MCGVCGLVSSNTSAIQVRDRLESSLRVLRHRGPDDSDLVADDAIGIGAVRLAVRDVLDGNQPVRDLSGRYSLVFNGELFNLETMRRRLVDAGHVLRTTGDTEVALAAFQEWGIEFVRHLRGMFAVLLMDHNSKTLYGFRDALGIKPLFYFKRGQTFAAASEIKALAHLVEERLSPRTELFDEFLVFGDIAGDRTLLNDVYELPPGSWFAATSSDLRISRYWTPFQEPDFDGTEDEALEALDWHLRDAVTAWTESDVPMAAMVSGGLDSTLVASLALEEDSQLHAFFADVAGAEPQEWEDFKACADFCNLKYSVVSVTESDLERLVPSVVEQSDEPLMDFNAITLARVNEGVRESLDFKVLLCGEGNDEIFAGYGRHQMLTSRQGGLVTPDELSIGTNAVALPRVDLLVNQRQLNLGYRRAMATETAAHTSLGQVLDFDQRTFLNTRLRSQDQIGMMFSHEIRPVLLDLALVEFVNSLPDQMKIRNGFGKWLFRRFHAQKLPSSVSWRPSKVALQAPANRAFRSGFLREWLQAIVARDELLANRYKPSGVAQLLHSHRTGTDHSNTLWRVLSLHLWMMRF